jgi:putative membrane protein
MAPGPSGDFAMRSYILAGALALALPAAAHAQPATPVPPAAQYMMMAGQSDQFEIQTGKLAATKAMSPDIKKFGGQMVTDHNKSTAMVIAAAKKSGLPTPPPPPLKADQQAMLTELQGQSGAAFDKTYVSQQLKAHQEALALQSSYAKRGDDPNLKAAAGQIVPVVQMHLGMLQKMP